VKNYYTDLRNIYESQGSWRLPGKLEEKVMNQDKIVF